MDFIETLPESEGHNSILVFVDRCTKMAVFEACTNTLDTLGLAHLFIKGVISKHGNSMDVVSDRGSKFTSAFWKAMLTGLGITRKLSTMGHPQRDGQTEHANQTVKEYLQVYTGHLQDNWYSLLPLAKFAYNNESHTAINTTPFYANHSLHLGLSVDRATADTAAVQDHLQVLQTGAADIDLALAEAQRN